MKTFWRARQTPLASHADWVKRLDPKNRQPGTSAPTLAAVWAGPVEVVGTVREEGALAGFVIQEIVAEAQSAVDDFSGPRNHDLVVHGRLPNGERVVVCIEAKAGEDFGPTVAQQQRAAAKALAKAQRETAKTGTLKTSNAEARLQGLLQRFVPYPATEPRVQQLRYQLLTALAGTISVAEDCAAPHAVLMMHEFLTDERDDERVVKKHTHDLQDFSTTVFGLGLPGAADAPWCMRLGTPEGAPELTLYLAHAVTDLRARTLEGSR